MAVHLNAHSFLSPRFVPHLFAAVAVILGLHAAHADKKDELPKINRKPGFSEIHVARPSKNEEPIARIGSAHSDAEVKATTASN